MRLLKLLSVILMCTITACAINGLNSGIQHVNDLMGKNKLEQAKAELKELIELYPDDSRLLYQLGNINYRQNNYYECLNCFEKAERKGFEGNAELYRMKGISAYKTGDMTNAETNLRKSVEMLPMPETHKYLGLLHLKNGDYDAASGSLSAALKNMPSDEVTITALGKSYYNLAQYSDAFEILGRIPVESMSVDILYLQAYISMYQNNLSNAKNLFGRIPDNSTFYDSSIYNLGEINLELGDYHSSAASFEKYIVNHPEHYNARFNLAFALLKAEKYSPAVDVLTNLLENNTLDVRVNYNLGLAFQALGAYEQSSRCLSSAAALNPDDTDGRYALGLTLSKMGRLEEARLHMTAAVALDPANKNAAEWLNRNRIDENTIAEPADK